MLSRFLEKKIEIEVQEIPGNTLELEYYLTESETACGSEIAGDREYGIQIVKRENGASIESIIFKDVFPVREDMRELIRRMAENTVTPVTLPYIIDDIL